MTLPEFAILVNSMNTEGCIGDKFDAYYGLYTILNSILNETDDIQIAIDSIKQQGTYKFKLISKCSNFSYLALTYHNYLMKYFNKSFKVLTNLRKDGTIYITLIRC